MRSSRRLEFRVWWVLAGIMALPLWSNSATGQACAGHGSDGPHCLERIRDFIHGQAADLPTFWHYSAHTAQANRETFTPWFSNAKFKDISPKFGNARFMKGPIEQTIWMDEFGRLRFERRTTDKFAHTLLEVSVNHRPERGHFVDYDGYRSMRPGVPYELLLVLRVVGSHWWKTIPWLVALQGHAMPDIFDRGKKYNPPFALVVVRGRWQVHIRADSRLSLPADRSYQRNQQIDLGPIEANQWAQFRFRIVWGADDESGPWPGGMAIYRDSMLKHTEVGRANFYNNVSHKGVQLGPYITFGAYVHTKHVQHEDAVIEFRELRLDGGQWP